MNSIRQVPSRMKSKMTETSLGEERERFDKQQVSLMAIKGSEIYYFTSALMQIVYVFDKRQAEIFEVMLPKKVVIVKKP